MQLIVARPSQGPVGTYLTAHRAIFPGHDQLRNIREHSRIQSNRTLTLHQYRARASIVLQHGYRTLYEGVNVVTFSEPWNFYALCFCFSTPVLQRNKIKTGILWSCTSKTIQDVKEFINDQANQCSFCYRMFLSYLAQSQCLTKQESIRSISTSNSVAGSPQWPRDGSKLNGPVVWPIGHNHKTRPGLSSLTGDWMSIR